MNATHTAPYEGNNHFYRNGAAPGEGYPSWGYASGRENQNPGAGMMQPGPYHSAPGDRQQQFFGFAAPLAPLLSNRTPYYDAHQQYPPAALSFFPSYAAHAFPQPPRSIHPSPLVSSIASYHSANLPLHHPSYHPYSATLPGHPVMAPNPLQPGFDRRPSSHSRANLPDYSDARLDDYNDTSVYGVAGAREMRGRGDGRPQWEGYGNETRFSGSVGSATRFRPVMEQTRQSRSLNRGDHGMSIFTGKSRAIALTGVCFLAAVSAPSEPTAFVQPPQRQGHPVAAPAVEPVEYQLVANISPVPPPPPLAKSAVPLADLAIELVWDACRYAAMASPLVDRSSSSLDKWSQASQSKGAEATLVSRLGRADGRSSPRTPELYGAIGEGRQRQRSTSPSSSDDGGSTSSSPTSSSPETPAGSMLLDASLTSTRVPRERSGGLGVEFGYNEAQGQLKHEGAESALEAMRSQVRRLNNLPPPAPAGEAPTPTLATEPSPAFREFVKQVLTTTLLAPEDLVLAVRYIASLPLASMIPPTPCSRRSNSQASAVKAAPFKLILGALMLANKVSSTARFQSYFINY